MEHTYQYAWIIPFVPLPVPIVIGVGLILFPTTFILHVYPFKKCFN